MTATSDHRHRDREVVLVSCSATKAKVRAARARELYSSPLFAKSLAYAELVAPGHVYVLSAEHRLVELDKVISSYDRTFKSMSKERRMWWGIHVVDSLAKRYSRPRLIVLAGEDYAGPIRGAALRLAWTRPHEPLRGLMVGQRLAWLNDRIAELRPRIEPVRTGELSAPDPEDIIIPRSPPVFKPTKPFVVQRQSPLGWRAELYDPTLPAPRQNVGSRSPDKRLTSVDKHRWIKSYLAKRDGDDE